MLILDISMAGHQYAYTRRSCTEQHLLEMTDLIGEANQEGLSVYVATIDVDGASDKVAHKLLPQCLQELNVRPCFQRFLKK